MAIPRVMQKFNAFMTGFASVFSCVGEALALSGQVFGHNHKRSQEPPVRKNIDYFDGFKKDRQALFSDWQAIGNDLRRGIDEYVRTHQG